MTGLVDRRIGLLFLLFLILLGLACGRAAWLGTVRAGELSERAVGQQVEDLEVSARRGTITDRRGLELAVSEDAVTVFANPFLIKDPSGTATKLAPLVKVDREELLDTLSDKDKGFVYLRRKLDSDKGDKVEKLGIEGIGTVVEPRRTYPQGELAGQLIGTVGTDNYGLSGVEHQFEDRLHGRDGHRRLVKDATGETVSFVETDRAESGEDIRLTIDATLQERVEAVMADVGANYQPEGATAVVMDPRNGELLALANWPRVDANNPGGAPVEARMNRAVMSSFEPGSTFKPFTVAGAIEEKLVRPDSTLEVPQEIQVADRTIGEAHEGGAGTLTVAEILARSSNVGSVMIGLDLGPVRFDKWVRRFGFGKPTGISLPGEAGGIVPKPEDYSGSSLGNMPIGQGLAVTPLQMVAAYSGLANGGVMHKPHVVAGEQDNGRRVVSAETAAQVSKMLEGVLGAGGTAQEASVPGYRLAGKTGTAEKPDPETGGYSEFKFFSSFIGYAPAKDPRLMIGVMVDEPKGGYYGAEVAAPAFERIVEFALPYMRIPPD
ncbi:MAG TPA: penicillin-binding protein 2 [Thermoleophilaceae bacterium]|nr:penicillin-binding protein 2 [Thermoleophilaceae bacterium]